MLGRASEQPFGHPAGLRGDLIKSAPGLTPEDLVTATIARARSKRKGVAQAQSSGERGKVTLHVATLSGMSDWWDWVQRVAIRQHEAEELRNGEVPGTAIARKIGIDQSAPNGWRTGHPRPEMAARFARAYKVSVIDAFVACGWITAKEAGQTTVVPDPGKITDEELVEQVAKRLRDARKVADGGDAPEGAPSDRGQEQQADVRAARKRAATKRVEGPDRRRHG